MSRDTDNPKSPDYDPLAPGATGVGWVVYAAIMLFIAGTWNFIDGILAIGKSKVYVAGAHFVFSDLKTWGWIVLILGVVQLVAALSLLSASPWARWFAIAVAALNAIGQLMFLPAFPFWALTMFTLDMLVIYGLAVYGKSGLRDM